MTPRPRVYAAHAMTCYGTEHERASLDTLAGLFPDAEIVDPAGMFASSTEWLDRWPDVLDGLDALVLFADEHGMVGAGCLREVADAIAAGVPVAYLDPCFGLCELAGFDFLPASVRTRAATAWPIAGEQVDPRALCLPIHHNPYPAS